MALVQVTFFIGYLITGWLIQPSGNIPWEQLLHHGVLGWIAIFPLAALQLWISQSVKIFGKSLILHVSFVLPNVIVVGLVSHIAAWLPYSPPYFAMYPQGFPLSPRLNPMPFWFIVGFTFVLYLFVGWRSFGKREWN